MRPHRAAWPPAAEAAAASLRPEGKAVMLGDYESSEEEEDEEEKPAVPAQAEPDDDSDDDDDDDDDKPRKLTGAGAALASLSEADLKFKKFQAAKARVRRANDRVYV